jgi:hypothetical protein
MHRHIETNFMINSVSTEKKKYSETRKGGKVETLMTSGFFTNIGTGKRFSVYSFPGSASFSHLEGESYTESFRVRTLVRSFFRSDLKALLLVDVLSAWTERADQ